MIHQGERLGDRGGEAGRIVELAADVEAETSDADAALERPRDQMLGFERPHAELRRQVALGVRAAVGEPDEEPYVVRRPGELLELDLVVDDEGAHARVDRLGDLGRLLDRVRVDDPVGVDPLEQRQLLPRRDIEAASLVGESSDHVGMREGFDRVVEVHERQRRGEPLVLAAHALGVQQQDGRAVQGDRGARDVGGQQRRGLVAADVADRPRRTRLAPRGCARGGGDGYGGDADGGGCGHDSCSRVRRPSRRPVLAVMVKAPAAIA